MLGRLGLIAAAMMRFCISRFGLVAGSVGLGAPVGVPATAEVFALGGGAPTTMPVGRPFAAAPLPPPVEFPVPVMFGVPGASVLPPGEA